MTIIEAPKIQIQSITLSASILKNKKILFQSLFWKKFPSKNCEISFKFPLRNLIKLR